MPSILGQIIRSATAEHLRLFLRDTRDALSAARCEVQVLRLTLIDPVLLRMSEPGLSMARYQSREGQSLPALVCLARITLTAWRPPDCLGESVSS